MEVHVPPNDDEEIAAMEREIKAIVGGPIIRSANTLTTSDIYLARSWLLSIHSYVRHSQGDTLFEDRVGGGKQQLLVSIANRLDLDVEALLDADPRDELAMILEGLRELEED